MDLAVKNNFYKESKFAYKFIGYPDCQRDIGGDQNSQFYYDSSTLIDSPTVNSKAKCSYLCHENPTCMFWSFASDSSCHLIPYLDWSQSQESNRPVRGDRFCYTEDFYTCGNDKNELPAFVIYNFPSGTYPPNQECLWRVKVEKGLQICASIIDFSIEHSDQCEFDKVTISSVIEDGSKLEQAQLCGDLSPQTIKSASNEMHLHFISDESLERQGFRIGFLPGKSIQYTGHKNYNPTGCFML